MRLKIRAQTVRQHWNVEYESHPKQLIDLHGGQELRLINEYATNCLTVQARHPIFRENEKIVVMPHKMVSLALNAKASNKCAPSLRIKSRLYDEYLLFGLFKIVRCHEKTGSFAGVHRAIAEVQFCHEALPFDLFPRRCGCPMGQNVHLSIGHARIPVGGSCDAERMEIKVLNQKKYPWRKPKMGWALSPKVVAMGPVHVTPTVEFLPLLGGHPDPPRNREGKRNLTSVYLHIGQPKPGRLGRHGS